jgi:hypothetical protein
MAGPRLIVDGPSFTPLPYGLWDAAQKPTPPSPHWRNGITWIERCPTGGTVYDECLAVTGTGGTPAAQAALSANVTQTNRGATSFTVYAEFDCSPIGLDNAMSIAGEALSRVENWQVERAFWTGTAGASGTTAQTTVWPHLASNAQLIDPSDSRIVLQTAASQYVTGGDDAAVVLGVLEDRLSDCYHGQGVIHMSPFALPTFTSRDLVENVNGQLLTRAGNLVVCGSGYNGAGPDGSAPATGSSWVYATGAVFGYRGEIQIPGGAAQQFDRTENTYRLIAQRTYVLGWECCHLAALVTLGVPT